MRGKIFLMSLQRELMVLLSCLNISTVMCQKERKIHTFFSNEGYLSQSTSKSKHLRSQVPGSAYFDNIISFIDQHNEDGELYTEFLKTSCKDADGLSCQYCSDNGWVGIPMTKIPRPVPDSSALPKFKHLPVGKTPNLDNDGNERLPDDWQPRSNIRSETEAISEFSQKYIVEEKYVKANVVHLTTLDNVKNMRQKKAE